MIAKKVAIRAVAKGKVARLVNYLLDEKGKQDRVAAVAVTNCCSEETAWAIREMQATQERNQRAKGDKTYHLVVSFRSGEDVSAEALREIEEEFARSLGFAGHQRISVVHRDTDNLHLHVAINKVHPERFTLHEPFNDYHALDKLCRRLEQKHDLEPDRGKEREPRETRRDVPAPAKAATMEAVAGVESLVGYVQRSSLRELAARAQSWEELHAGFAKAGVTLKARGNGLVVQSGGKTAKASSCGREFSKVALERRLGAFQAQGANREEAPSEGYRAKPIQNRGAELFQQYQAARTAAQHTKTAGFRDALAAHRRRCAAAQQAFKLQRSILSVTPRGTLNRVMFALHRTRLKNQVEASYKTYRADKAATQQSAKLLAWNDWLIAQAARGNRIAQSALQARRAPKIEPPRKPIVPKIPSNARPDYTRANSARTWGFRRLAARLFQSRAGGAAPRGAPGTLASVRNLSDLHVVRDQARSEMLLQPDAPDRLGRQGSAGHAVRRPGAGVDRTGGEGSRGGSGGVKPPVHAPYVTRGGTWRDAGKKGEQQTTEQARDWTVER